MANLKFYRGNSSKVTNAAEGAIWFNIEDKTINVKVGSEWEKYAGNLEDASWDATKSTLTIKKFDGSSIDLDFSDMASATAVSTKIGTYADSASNTDQSSLHARINQAFLDISALSGDGGSVSTQIKNAIEALDVTDTAVVGQYVSSVSETDGKITVTRADLPDYTEVYDAKGAAGEALTAANKYTDDLANGAVKSNSDAIGVLNGNDTVEGSVDKKIKDAINAFAGSVDDDNTIENVTELLAYVSGVDGSTTLAAAIANIADNKGKIETLNGNVNTAGSVDKKIADAVGAINCGVLSVTEGSTNGTISVDGTDVSVHGLGSAAYTNSDAYDASGSAAAVLGTSGDGASANTVYGVKAYADSLLT